MRQEDVSALMSDEFTSDIISEFKENKGTITRGDTTFKLAEYYGFCWGVERAVAMAFQARKHFPDQVLTRLVVPFFPRSDTFVSKHDACNLGIHVPSYSPQEASSSRRVSCRLAVDT